MTTTLLPRRRALLPRRLVLTTLFAACVLGGRLLLAGDWPQWRGPRGDSTSDEKNLPLQWSESSGVAWKTPLPEWGTSTPAISGNALFVTTHEEERGGKLLLIKLDRRTGKIEWTREAGSGEANRESLPATDGTKHKSQKFHRLQNLASPSPVTDGERVIAHFGNGDLAAFDFAGKQLWKRNLQSDHGMYTIWWGHANSPVLFGDLVISVCMQDSLVELGDPLSPSYLVAHDSRTGDEVWKTMRMTNAKAEECDSYITPVLHHAGVQHELIVIGGDQLNAYDPATGKQIWFLPGLAKSRIITGPTISGGNVYATLGMRGSLLSVPIGRPSGRTTIGGERPATDIRWRLDKSTPDSCSPVLSGNLLFIVADNGVAQCVDSATGNVHWTERLPGDYKASPLSADGRIYFLNTTGVCTVISAASAFKKLSENKLDDDTTASPAVSDGHIVIRGRKSLYSIGRVAGQ